MKKFTVLVLAAVMTLGMGTTVFAAVANPNLAKLVIDGKQTNCHSYVIDGYTYFKLRDLGALLDFTVGWDAAASSISITTPWAGDTVQDPNKDIVIVPEEKEEETEEEMAERYIEEVIDLVNEEREKEGLDPLKTTDKLSESAQIRAEELKEKYSHDRPDGTECFTVLDDVGIGRYYAAGENIALGQKTPEQVVNAWMNSEGHRKNIMNRQFEEIGVGYEYNNGWSCWAQMFIG